MLLPMYPYGPPDAVASTVLPPRTSLQGLAKRCQIRTLASNLPSPRPVGWASSSRSLAARRSILGFILASFRCFIHL